MDREMAGAVFQRWERGLPISEAVFYKAAAVIGVDPEAALTEARFLTAFDKYASENRAMTPLERMYFGLAAGIEDPTDLVKTASIYKLNQDEIIVRVLQERNFQPDFEKIALMPPPEVIQEMMAQQQQQAGGDGGQGGGAPGADPAGGGGADPAAAAEQAAQPQGPMPGQQVQQQPSARFKPAPTAPEQVAPGAMGNLDELLQGQQDVHGEQAMENGGLPPSGAQEPAPPAPTPDERIQQVAPTMDPETISRYAEKLTEFEQQMGMPLSDPKQMVKFVESMQKVDTKYMQEGIKQFAEQQEAEMGIGQQVTGQTPTVKGFGPNDSPQAGGPPPGGDAAGPEGGAPPAGPEAAAGPPEEAGPPGAGPPPPGGAAGPGGKPKVQPGQPLPAAQAAGTKPKPGAEAAAEKVAHAARVLARAHSRI